MNKAEKFSISIFIHTFFYPNCLGVFAPLQSEMKREKKNENMRLKMEQKKLVKIIKVYVNLRIKVCAGAAVSTYPLFLTKVFLLIS